MMYCSLQVRYLASRWFAFYTDICSKCDCFGGVVLGNSSYLLCSLRKNLWEKLSSCFREKDKFSSFASNYQSLSLKINFWVQLRSREHTILVCPVFKAEFMNSNFRLTNLQNIYISGDCDGDHPSRPLCLSGKSWSSKKEKKTEEASKEEGSGVSEYKKKGKRHGWKPRPAFQLHTILSLPRPNGQIRGMAF